MSDRRWCNIRVSPAVNRAIADLQSLEGLQRGEVPSRTDAVSMAILQTAERLRRACRLPAISGGAAGKSVEGKSVENEITIAARPHEERPSP